jgi:methionyl-tRNA synthetase
VNRDLADVFGNFVNRILKFTESKFEGHVPEGGEAGELEARLYQSVSAKLAALTANLATLEMRKAAQELRGLWVLGNEYLQEAAPWTAIKTDPARAAVIVRTALNMVALFARVSAPFIPFTAEKLAEGVGEAYPGSWPSTDAKAELSKLEPGRAVHAPEVLIKKIEDDQLAEWTARFGGAEG